jgi:antitoxin ParD1/3/4
MAGECGGAFSPAFPWRLHLTRHYWQLLTKSCILYVTHAHIVEEHPCMSTLNISIPVTMKAFVETQVRSGLYSSASDYVRTLIRADQQRRAEALVDAQLLAHFTQDGLAGVTPELCAWLRTRLCHSSDPRQEASG